MKIIILGGTGGQGLYSTKEIIKSGLFSEIVIGDIADLATTQKAIDALNANNVTAAQIDVMDKPALIELLNGADVVANCTGPYYLLGKHVVDAAIDAGVHYIDFCDDISVYYEIFTEDYQKRAKENDVTVIIGLGASPGILPLIAVHGAQFMDQIDAVDIYMGIHTADTTSGPAVVLHTLENFVGEVGIIRDGKLYMEQPYEGEIVQDFGGKIGKVTISTMGHPEVFSLPRVMNANNIAIKLGMYPEASNTMIKFVTQMGFADLEPIIVNGEKVIPRDFLMALLGNRPEKEVEGTPISAFFTEIRGSKDNESVRYKLNMFSSMGPLTGVPLAIGAEMLAKGEIKKRGILVTEEAITNAKAFIEDTIKRIKKAGYPMEADEELEKKTLL